jgi:hypothetical protein
LEHKTEWSRRPERDEAVHLYFTQKGRVRPTGYPLDNSVANYPKFHKKKMRMLCIVTAVTFCAAGGTVFANGLGEGKPWQFGTTSDQVNKTNIAATISKERAGAFGPGDTTINYDVRGNLNNCNLNATAIGNTGSNTQDAPMGSPTVGLDSSVTSGATGNDAQNTTTGGNADATTTAGGMVESATGIGDTTTQAPNNSTVLNSTQANTGSQLSTVGSVSNDYAVAGVYGTGGSGQANLNATQTVANTDLTSSVQGSSACNFQDMGGNLASPINAITTMSNQ